MSKTGFDNQLYIEKQSAEIRKRISDLGGKLYLEFGGKLFDDFHASRVLPGFAPDSKIQMLKALADKAEIIIAINAGDIVKNKIRGDLGITYDQDVLRLIDAFRGFGLFVSSVVITRYTGNFTDYLEKRSQEELPASQDKAPKKETQPKPARQKKLKFTFKEQREYDTIEADIAALEDQVASLEREMTACGSDYVKLQELTQAQEEAKAALEEKMERWLYLTDLAERIAAQE